MEVAMINKDEAAGKIEQAKGSAKQKVGEWTNDPDLEAEGAADQVAGEVRETGGTVKRKVGDAVDEVKERLPR
jgi:uncharacterized protein YjbJ (UPF0337 family)